MGKAAPGERKEKLLAMLSSEVDTTNEETSIKLYGMELPCPISLDSVWNNPPALSPAIISGVLRQGHKLMLSGPSKAGKTFCLMELAVCVASGKPWLGLFCKKGKVLYINLELSSTTCYNRFKAIGAALGVTDISGIMIWNLRGFAVPFSELAKFVADMVKNDNLSVVIVDPIYKVFTGSENDQEAVTEFCNSLDVIAKAGASVVYCHHHSKGIQGNKSSMDRASGSGVFARDADALIDLIEIFPSDDSNIDPEEKGVTAWEVSFVLREFKPRKPIKVLFDYPLHIVSQDGRLDNAEPMTARKAGGRTRGQAKAAEKLKKLREFEDTFSAMVNEGITAPSVKEIAERLGVSSRTVSRYVGTLAYSTIDGKIYKSDIKDNS